MKDYIYKIKSKNISNKLKSFNGNQSFDEINEYMNNKSYDIVGIHNTDGMIDSYIKRNENKTHFIKIEEIISSEMPLIELILKFIETNNKRFFLIDGDNLNSIVTEADLLKEPVRMVLFNIISSFELMLTEKLKNSESLDLERNILLLAKKEKANGRRNNFVRSFERYERLKKESREISFFDNLYLIKKMEICKKHNLLNINNFKIDKINGLRNSIVHGDNYISDNKNDLYDLVEIILKNLK